MTMSDHINQPLQTPTIPGGSPRTFSRSNIMGTVSGTPPWTMFMPGQSSGRPDEYPKDWPAAGRLLRVPKCVFLTSCPPAHLWGKNFTLMSKWTPFGYLGHWDDAVIRDTRYDPAVAFPYGTLIFGGFTGTYGYIGWTIDPQYPPEWDGRRKFHKCCVVDNAMYHEHYRLIGEFQKAKEILEARYPQDVFVEICEFFPNDPAVTIAPNDELSPRVFDVYTPDGYAANQPKSAANGPVWMLGPDNLHYNPDSGYVADFFGTNFLHIYCGYQADSGASNPPSVEDTVSRWHWYNQTWGYKLDRNFGPGCDSWVESTAIPSGYEGGSYDQALKHMNAAMGNESLDEAIQSPIGKLDKLRIGWKNFSGYRVALHEYDCKWSFPGASFLAGAGVTTRMPPGSVIYGDQDWVEQTIILAYDIRKAIYEASDQAKFGDGYFPGPEGLLGDGAYNTFDRYPGTDQYVNDFVPILNQQHDLLQAAITGIGPKTVTLWNTMIDTHSLSELGFSYEGGSSKVTADYIVSFVEDHYGLTPPL